MTDELDRRDARVVRQDGGTAARGDHHKSDDPPMSRCPVCGLLCYSARYRTRDGVWTTVLVEAAPRADGSAWLDAYEGGVLVARVAGPGERRFRYASHTHDDSLAREGRTWLEIKTEGG